MTVLSTLFGDDLFVDKTVFNKKMEKTGSPARNVFEDECLES